MMASASFLSTLVSIAVLVTAISPFVLILLLIKDWKNKQIW